MDFFHSLVSLIFSHISFLYVEVCLKMSFLHCISAYTLTYLAFFLLTINWFFFYISDDIEIEPLLEPSSGTDGDSEPVYGNVGLCTIVPVKVEDLWDYVKANKINEAEGLKREYRVSGLICVHQ